MEYGNIIGDCTKDMNNCDDNFTAHVGYEEINPCIRKLFSKNSVKTISRKITELLMGLDNQNRPIIVPDKMICTVLSDIYRSYRPQTGDIHTRYVVPQGQPENYVQSIINQTIEIITNDVKNNFGMELENSKLTRWSTVYGDFNPQGLRQHPPIKLRNKRPNPMQFFQNY